MTKEEKLQSFRKTFDDARSERDRLQGTRDGVLTTLSEKYGIKSLADGEEREKELTAKIQAVTKEEDEKIAFIEKEFVDLGGSN